MSDINFCNTKEQLNHLGEVVTGKVDGSPAGADIATSTLPYTGQVRKTLPALEAEYQEDIDNFNTTADQVITDKTKEFEESIESKEMEADAAIDAYRLLPKGNYVPGIILANKFEFIVYNGESYFAKNPPYTTTSTTPDVDVNLFVSGYVSSYQIGGLTNYQAASIDDMAQGKTIGGDIVVNEAGFIWIVNLSDEVGIYVLTESSDYPRVDIGGGLYAARRYFGSTLKMNEHDWRIETGGYRKPFTGSVGNITGRVPYTQDEWDKAYWNGKMIQLACEHADNNNMKKVIPPEGEVILCYSTTNSTSDAIGRDLQYGAVNSTNGLQWVYYAAITLSGITGLELDYTKTSFKVIFDSLNRNPYDKRGIGTSSNVWDMKGQVFGRRACNNFKLIGSLVNPVIGDAYCRDYINEFVNIETTNCIVDSNMNFNIYTSGSSRGFMADSMATHPAGTNHQVNLTDKIYRGGFNSVGEEDDSDPTKRRTEKISINHSELVRDTLQISVSGYTRSPSVRNKNIGVYFYGAGDVFLQKSETEFLEDIKIGESVESIRLEFYDDERTSEAVVSYGTVLLVSGSSANYIIDDFEAIANRRGGIANVPNDTTIRNTSAYDMGKLKKYGWPDATGATRYFLNLEDRIVRNLTVNGFTGRGSLFNGFLLNPKSFNCSNVDIDSTFGIYSAVESGSMANSTVYSTFESRGVSDSQRLEKGLANIAYNNITLSKVTPISGVTDYEARTMPVYDNCKVVGDGELSGNKNATYRNMLIDATESLNYKQILNIAGKQASLINVEVDATIINSSEMGYRTVNLQQDRGKVWENVKIKSNVPACNFDFTGVTDGFASNVNYTTTTATLPACEIHLNLGATSSNELKNVNINAPSSYVRIKAPQLDYNLTLNGGSISASQGLYTTVGTSAGDPSFHAEILFDSVEFDCSSTNFLYALINTVDNATTHNITFLNCKFINNSVGSRNVKFINEARVGLTSRAINCIFKNVTNTDGVTTITGEVIL